MLMRFSKNRQLSVLTHVTRKTNGSTSRPEIPAPELLQIYILQDNYYLPSNPFASPPRQTFVYLAPTCYLL